MTKTVAVTQIIEVTIDESKFDKKFLDEFKTSFYNFNLNDHIRHLAQLHARGLVDNKSFIEGYGPAKEMGIGFKIIDGEEEIL